MLTRFLLFLKRFLPLWGPLLLIWFVPASHEIARQNMGVSNNEIGPSSYWAAGMVNFARTHPNNVGAALEVALSGDDDEWNEENLPARDERLRQLPARFPQEKWLDAFCVSHMTSFSSGYSGIAEPNSKPTAAQINLKKELIRGKAREPKNAFWPIALARWEWTFSPRPFIKVPVFPATTALGTSMSPSGVYPDSRMPDDVPVLRHIVPLILETDKCTYYEDGGWKGMSALQQAQTERRNLSLEEQANNGDIFSQVDSFDTSDSYVTSLATPSYVGVKAGKTQYLSSPAIVSLGARKRMELGLALVHVGSLIEDEQGSGRRLSGVWLSSGWSLAQLASSSGSVFSPSQKLAFGPPAQTAFIARARHYGFLNIASRGQAIVSHVAAHSALLQVASTHGFESVEADGRFVHSDGIDALFPEFAFRSGGWCAILFYGAVSLSVLWLALTVYLFKGQGKPSSPFMRWGTAALVATVVVILGLMKEWIRLAEGSLLGHWGAFIISALLAFWCSFSVVKLNRAALQDAAFDKWNTTLVPPRYAVWLAPLGMAVSFGIVVVAALLDWFLSYSLPTSVISIPILGYVSANTFPVYLALYGIASLVVVSLFWLGTWRFGWKKARSITHSGLRWWKETIGASICVCAWLYLLIALAAWPARTQAKGMIQERWQKGDWAFLQAHLNEP